MRLTTYFLTVVCVEGFSMLPVFLCIFSLNFWGVLTMEELLDFTLIWCCKFCVLYREGLVRSEGFEATFASAPGYRLCAFDTLISETLLPMMDWDFVLDNWTCGTCCDSECEDDTVEPPSIFLF